MPEGGYHSQIFNVVYGAPVSYFFYMVNFKPVPFSGLIIKPCKRSSAGPDGFLISRTELPHEFRILCHLKPKGLTEPVKIRKFTPPEPICDLCRYRRSKIS